MRWLPVAAAAIGLIIPAGADESSPDWQKIRDQQPAALHLTVKLPKAEFFQGEEIDAMVSFTNDDPAKGYQLDLMRIPWIVNFHAIDEAGHPTENPIDWYYRWYGICWVGPVQMEKLGSYTAPFPVNRTAYFDHPGVYRIYAESSVREDTRKNPGPMAAQLVSDPVTVTITPRSAEQEKAALADADHTMDGPPPASPQCYNATSAGMDKAVYLQSPAGQDFVIAHLDNPGVSREALESLLMTSDPSRAAALILQRVKAGNLTLDEQGVESYGILKTADLIRHQTRVGMSQAESQRFNESLMAARKAAQRELLDQAIEVSAADPTRHIEALWAAFQDQAIHKNPGEEDADGGKARAAVVAHQLDLPSLRVEELMNAWPYWGSADFRPLLVRQDQRGDIRALVALAEIDPRTARPEIIKDLSAPYPRLFHEGYNAREMLGRMTPMPLPQFDDLFRQRLKQTLKNPGLTIPVIAAFGSPALLPDVVTAYHQYGREHWGALLDCFFRYWLRCDPAGGAAGMEEFLQSAKDDGLGTFDDMFLQRRGDLGWRPEYWPVIRWALEHGKIQMALNAASAAQIHGDKTWASPVIATLERFRADKEFAPSVVFIAREALKTSRWPLTDEEKRRLESLAAPAGT